MPGGQKNAPEARNTSAIAPQYLFCGNTATVAPRTYFFLSCQKKVCKKEALDAFYSAYARKGVSFRCAYFRYAIRSPNALRATVKSGFLSAR